MIQKKHRNQMNALERLSLDSFVSGLDLLNFKLTNHTIDRIASKFKECLQGYTVKDFIDCLSGSFDVIEYKLHHGEQRLVIRSEYDINGYSFIFVINDKQTIVTAWTNHIGDTHRTLDLSEYNEKLKIGVD